MTAAVSSTTISGRQILNFAAALDRSTDGAVQCSVGLKDRLTRRNQLFMPFITTINLGMEQSAKATYVSDIEGFCKLWCSEQSLQTDDVQLIRGSCDMGGTLLKVSFSFLTSCSDEQHDVVGSAVSQSGVRRICVFLVASGVKESYDVMKKLLQLVDNKI